MDVNDLDPPNLYSANVLRVVNSEFMQKGGGGGGEGSHTCFRNLTAWSIKWCNPRPGAKSILCAVLDSSPAGCLQKLLQDEKRVHQY